MISRYIGGYFYVYATQVVSLRVSWYAVGRKDVTRMNTYVTGATVKQLREGKNMTQAELAERIGVSSKTVSKWETGISQT